MPESALQPVELGIKFQESELVIGVVGAVGTEIKTVVDTLKEYLAALRACIHR